MNASLIKVGNSYLVKIGKNEVKVRVVKEKPDGGWMVNSLAGGSTFLVKDSGRFLRCLETLPVTAKTPAIAPVPAQAPAVATVPVQPPAPVSVPALQIPVSALASTRKLTMLDAAAEVLKSASQPMSSKEMISAMEEANLWKSPAGKTPANTLGAAINREIAGKENPRFKKTEKGKFALAGDPHANTVPNVENQPES